MDGHVLARAETVGSFFPPVQEFLFSEASGKIVSSPTPGR